MKRNGWIHSNNFGYKVTYQNQHKFPRIFSFIALTKIGCWLREQLDLANMQHC